MPTLARDDTTGIGLSSIACVWPSCAIIIPLQRSVFPFPPLAELRDEAKPYTAQLQEFGKVECRVADFGAIWERYPNANEIVVADEELWFEPVTGHIPASVDLVWEAQCNPTVFAVWNTLLTNHHRAVGIGSRVYAGAVNHCEHGKEKLALRYVYVRPFKHFTQEMALPQNEVSRWTMSFSEIDSGTALTIRVARPDAPGILSALVLRTTGYLFTRNGVRTIFQKEFRWLKIDGITITAWCVFAFLLMQAAKRTWKILR